MKEPGVTKKKGVRDGKQVTWGEVLRWVRTGVTLRLNGCERMGGGAPSWRVTKQMSGTCVGPGDKKER